LKPYKLTYKHYGKRSILVEWPSEIDENILKDILIYKKNLVDNIGEVILEINNSYNSLLITYNVNIENIYDAFSELKTLYAKENTNLKLDLKLWTIPVCYDAEFGVDLELLSSQKKLSKNDIIRLHSKTLYSVYAIGFLPGFLYLGGLVEELHIPRKSQPVLNIQKGAVGIGGNLIFLTQILPFHVLHLYWIKYNLSPFLNKNISIFKH